MHKYLFILIIILGLGTVTPTHAQSFTGTLCPTEQQLTQNIKVGARNGTFHPYTGMIVTQAHLLQQHLNRLGFNSGTEDGIIGPISLGAIQRMQTFLNVVPDGIVGPITRASLNSSCETVDEVPSVSSFQIQRRLSKKRNSSSSQEVVMLYTITFNTQGGIAIDPEEDIEEGTVEDLPTPIREGYLFSEWNTEADGSGIGYTDNITVEGDIILYAVWEEDLADFPEQIVLSAGGYWTLYEEPLSTPRYLEPFQDPETDMWITRISDGDDLAFEEIGDTQQIRHSYSKRSAWNRDGEYLVLSGSNPFLLDGETYEVLARTNMPSIWSNVDPLKAFGSYDNVFYWRVMDEGTYQGDYNDFVFADYTQMSTQTSENNLSNDDKYAALYGRKVDNDDAWIVVFDTELETIVAELNTGNSLSDVDWVSMSQSGDYVVVMYNTDGGAANQGVKVYDNELNFLRHLVGNTGHSDLGIAVDGKDVLVQWSGNAEYSLRADRLDGTGTTYLFPDQGTFGELGLPGAHISARNLDRPGYVYVSILENGTDADARRPSLYLISVKIDGSEIGEVWGKTYSRLSQSKYFHQSHAVANFDGTKVLFASNWDDDLLEAQDHAPAWVIQKDQPLP